MYLYSRSRSNLKTDPVKILTILEQFKSITKYITFESTVLIIEFYELTSFTQMHQFVNASLLIFIFVDVDLHLKRLLKRL
jgi:hypothetical protein